MINCSDSTDNVLIRLSSAFVGIILLVVILYPTSINAYAINTQGEGSFGMLLVLLLVSFIVIIAWVFLKFGRDEGGI